MIKLLGILVLGTMIAQAQNMEQLGEMLFFDTVLSKNKTLPVTTRSMDLSTTGTTV